MKIMKTMKELAQEKAFRAILNSKKDRLIEAVKYLMEFHKKEFHRGGFTVFFSDSGVCNDKGYTVSCDIVRTWFKGCFAKYGDNLRSFVSDKTGYCIIVRDDSVSVSLSKDEPVAEKVVQKFDRNADFVLSCNGYSIPIKREELVKLVGSAQDYGQTWYGEMTKIKESIDFKDPDMAKTLTGRGCTLMQKYKELNAIVDKIYKFASEGKVV